MTTKQHCTIFGTDHGACNVHIIRYLRKNTEETGHEWSGQMKGLFCEMNRDRKELTVRGGHSFLRKPCLPIRKNAWT